jgi:hypothetical protein
MTVAVVEDESQEWALVALPVDIFVTIFTMAFRVMTESLSLVLDN